MVGLQVCQRVNRLTRSRYYRQLLKRGSERALLVSKDESNCASNHLHLSSLDCIVQTSFAPPETQTTIDLPLTNDHIAGAASNLHTLEDTSTTSAPQILPKFSSMVTRMTVANNAKQSQKAPLLIAASAVVDPAAANSIRLLVHKIAQSKLKLKKPSRVFVKHTG